MVKHVVCFKLSDNSPENCKKAKEVLLSMKGNVPMLRDLSVGIDLLHSARSYDIILETVFDSMDDVSDYQKDPYHCSVVKEHMHKVAETSIAVDFEMD